jgi:hypothetical protein
MKRLQNKIKRLRAGLQELRGDLFLQSLPKKEKEMFYNSLKLLGEFEDIIIIKYILKNK